MHLSHPRTAPALMALGAFFLVANDTFVKLYASHLPTNQIIAVRSLATVACCIVILWYRRTPLPSLRNRDLFIRTGFTIANVYAFVIALVSLPFSLAVFIDLTNILFVALLAPMVLTERLTLGKLGAVTIGMLGAGIMLSLEAVASGWLILFPLLSALMGAGRELWTRRLGPEYSAVALTLYASIGMVIVGVFLGVGDWALNDSLALAAVLAAGLCHGVAMLLITTALQWGEASFVAPFRLTSLLWAVIVAWAVFGESFTASQMLGGGLIICALLVLTLLPKDNRR
ncbi:DMT family transporter [Ruegeria lacuscaerulensis]|uniref:DMT family transporter n=1 Tax=Ruegeria lacuscaerulensis TaxID=55218 RepID=UPI00147B4A6E|nr:DMT family transporter [Ruegeria lacuscaerulensis]